ncbi:hypothetical protein X975_03581, partial [Stegodyphus mimosarum]
GLCKRGNDFGLLFWCCREHLEYSIKFYASQKNVHWIYRCHERGDGDGRPGPEWSR